MNFSIIVAIDKNRGIGKDGDLPWSLPEDLKHFKKITTLVKNANNKNVVVMGRKTWESLPEKFRPLPNRINVVLTRNAELVLPDGVYQYDSFSKLISELKVIPNIERAFIIGGEQIFKEAINYSECEEVFLTKINETFDCDTFFPDIDRNFEETEKLGGGQSSDFTYEFLRLLRKK